jgi:integrase
MSNNMQARDAQSYSDKAALALASHTGKIPAPPKSATRKRGKSMSRRKGQNPEVRVGERADGAEYFFFQYWIDVAGQEERKRKTKVLGLVSELTHCEADRKKLDFLVKLQLNSDEYRIPSSHTFANAIKHYKETFAPRMLRDSTISTAESRIDTHLEADWKDVPIEHITIDAINKWAWKKRCAGISWTTIKDALRTMQRILSAFSKDKKPPFSQRGLEIPERDRLQMLIKSRKKVSYSWSQAQRFADQLRRLPSLGTVRREQYATLVLVASASGLRCSELLALRPDDLDFDANTIRVDESSDQRNDGTIGPCKNAAAYRTVLLHDAEGRKAMQTLRQFLGSAFQDASLVFRSRRGEPLLETTILRDGLHKVAEALGVTKAGLHAFRRGCNRRWELAGLTPAVIRQQMGHTSARMTELYTGEIPLEHVAAAFSNIKKMENEVAA